MLYYDRIDINEETDTTKSYLGFFNHGFEFQNSVCNGCHDLTILRLNISDIAVITVKGVDYLSIIHEIYKSEATHLLENSVFEDRGYIKKCISKKSIFQIDSTTILFDNLVKAKKIRN